MEREDLATHTKADDEISNNNYLKHMNMKKWKTPKSQNL